MPSPRKSSIAPHYVYLITDDEGRTKIGHSQDAKKRLVGLRTASAVRLSIAHVWALPSRREAVEMEANMHRLFRWARTFREWHKISTHDAQSVGDTLMEGAPDRATAIADALRRSAEAYAECLAFERSLSFRKRDHNERDRLETEAAAALERARAAETDALDWGHHLEPWLASIYNMRTDAKVLRLPRPIGRTRGGFSVFDQPAKSYSARGRKAALADYKAKRGLL